MNKEYVLVIIAPKSTETLLRFFSNSVSKTIASKLVDDLIYRTVEHVAYLYTEEMETGTKIRWVDESFIEEALSFSLFNYNLIERDPRYDSELRGLKSTYASLAQDIFEIITSQIAQGLIIPNQSYVNYLRRDSGLLYIEVRSWR